MWKKCLVTAFAVTASWNVAATNQRASATDEMIVDGRRSQPQYLDTPNLTGSRLGLSPRELPASISIVSQEDIQLRGARTALEAIEAAVGMTGQTGVGSIPGYVTRGFSSNDITVMRDGIRQNTNSQSARPLDSFLFNRIEVLKGPASLLYGEGAIGAAVNYLSKQASDTPEAEAFVSTGSWGRHRAGLGVGGPTGVDQLDFRIDVAYSHADGYVQRNREDLLSIGGELAWTISDRTRLRFAGSVLRDEIESYYGTPVIYDAVIDAEGVEAIRVANTATDRLVNARIDPATRRLNYNIRDNFADADNSFWRVIADTHLGDNWSLRNETYAATQRLDWRNVERNVWNPETELVDRSSFFLIYRRDVQLGNRLDLRWDGDWFGQSSRVVVGVLYDHNDQDRDAGQTYPRIPTPASVPLTGFDPGFGPDVVSEKTLNVLTRTAAVYAENMVELHPQVMLISGLRVDRIEVERESFIGDNFFTKSYSPLTGRLGAVYTPNKALSLYASYSRAAQPVSQLVSLSMAQEDFSLQQGVQVEIGAKTTFLHGRADATLALYDIEKSDLLTSSLIDGERINSQIGAQVSQGAEASVGFRQNGWRLHADLAWTWRARFDEFNENLGTGIVSRAGNTPPNVPKWVAGLFAAHEWGDWLLSANLRHVGERQANNFNGIQLKSYTRLDAALTRHWGPLDVILRGRNLTDTDHVEGAGAGGLMWRLGEPRSVELSLHYRH